MEVEHSRLLKFFKEGRSGSKMADTPIIKIEKEYENPPNVESEVLGAHIMREPDAQSSLDTTNNTNEVQTTSTEFSLTPVITVTKKETSLSKGDMKLQKVTVTEDVAMEETENGGYRISREEQSLRQTVRQTSSRTEVTRDRREKGVKEGGMENGERSQDEKKSKIPMSLRQAAEKVKKDRVAQKTRNQPRRSSIPKLKDATKAVKRETSLKFEPKLEDEFDKIYEEIVDNTQRDIDDKLLAVPIEDTEKIESRFEEIIQSYDEDEQEKHTVSRVSKIPALRRRGNDRPTKIGALVDKVKDKTPLAETKLKDGGFKVTASTIRTKRFSRGNSRDLSREEQKVEVTETIDIKQGTDNEVFVKETVKQIPVKPKRSIRSVSKKITTDGRKVDVVETVESTTFGYNEKINRETTVQENFKEGIPVSSTQVIARGMRKDDQDIKESEDGGSRTITTRTVTENILVTPVKTSRIARGVRREISKDAKVIENTEKTTNGGNSEIITVEEFNDSGGRTITTTTTVRESVKIGAPVITETIVQNISHEISTDSQNIDTKENNASSVTIEEIKDEDSEKNTEETIGKENFKIPVGVERFTRGFSIEMGNIRHGENKETVTIEEIKDSNQTGMKKTITRETLKVSSPTKTERIAYGINRQIKSHDPNITDKKDTISEKTKTNTNISFRTKSDTNINKIESVKETLSESVSLKTDNQIDKKTQNPDDGNAIIKKETLETEQIVKEGIKIGIPVFTKVTQNYVKGKIQNVEISKTIEWKPAEEAETKHYCRNVSEKVTKKELRDASLWNLKSTSISETTHSGEEPKAYDGINNKNETTKDPSLEKQIKDTVKDITSKIEVKNVTEYKSEEQITKTEKSTFTFSKSLDLSLDTDSLDTESKEFDEQTTLIDTKGIKETSIEQDSAEYSTETNNESVSTSVTVEKSETKYHNLTKQDKDSDNEAVTILKGNVSRLKDKITKGNVVVSKKETVEEISKEKSILSKIALFERLEPAETHPIAKLPADRKKCKYVPKDMHIEQKSKIVDEILKEPKGDSFGEINKVEIGVNCDEVTCIHEPVIVKEHWKPEEEREQRVSTVNQVLIEKVSISQTQQSIAKVTTHIQDNVLPETIDVTPNDSQVKIGETKSEPISIEGNENQFEAVTTMPSKIGILSPQSIIDTESIDDTNKIITNDNEYDYEADIGKTRPGKINLNVWKTQVETNKTLVDKINVIKEESLEDIPKTLPGKVDIEIYKSQVQVSKALPETYDFKRDETKFQYTKPLPGKIEPEIKEIQFEIVRIMPEKIGDRSGDLHHVEEITSTDENDNTLNVNKVEVGKVETEKTGEVSIEIAKQLPGKIDFTTKQIELPKILPEKKGYLRPLSYIGDSENETGAIKPAPGKLNLNLWKNKVETNKTLIGKTNTTKSQDNELLKSSKLDYKTYEKKIEVSKITQKTIDLNSKEYKVENVKTGTDSIKSYVETAVTLLAKNEICTTENQIEKIRSLPEIIDISNTESQVVEDETASDIIECNTSIEPITTIPGRIDYSVENNVENLRNITEIVDFKTSLDQVEAYEALPVTIDFETYESQVETTKSVQDNTYLSTTEIDRIVPKKLNYKTAEGKVEISKPLPGKLDLAAWENKVEVNKSLVDRKDIVKSENLKQIAKTLPGKEGNGPRILSSSIDIRFIENKGHISKTLQAENNSIKLEIPIPHTESLSDPELVDEQESNTNNKSTILEKIKRKMFFITNTKSGKKSTDKLIENNTSGIDYSEENRYESKVEELLSKTYSINEISQNTSNQVTTVKETVTAQNISETIDENTNEIVSESFVHIATKDIQEPELKTDINKAQNNTIIAAITENNNKYETSEKEFNFETNRIHNQMSSSAYGAEDFKSRKEDIKRTKSLAELDLGEGIQGTVQRMVGRMKSVDFGRRDSLKSEKISLKEMPKKLSVWQKITLFEGKASPTKYESTTAQTKVAKKNDAQTISEEVYLQRIEQLTNAKTTYGRMDEMLYLHLANDLEMPVVSLGTALLDKRLLPHLIGAAIDLGYRAIDTAYIYGNEKEVGDAIKAKIDDGTVRREDLFISSKLWSTFHRTDLVEEACRTSLKNLGLDYFDLYMIHNPMSFKEGNAPIPKIATVLQYSDYDYLDAWYGMEGLVSKGLVKSIGVSNFNSQQIQKILDKGKLKPMVNQVECHPYLSQQRLDAFCTERNITLSCFGVLGSKGTPANYKSSVTPAIDDSFVKVMASGLGITPAQLLIRYQIERGHNVVVKASTAAHLWDNLQALTFTLDHTQVAALHALNRNKRIFTFAGMGDTHKNYPFLAPY